MKQWLIIAATLCTANLQAEAAETIAVTGSTTLLPVVAQAAAIYHQQHPDITITVSGGGSGVGIASVIQGTAQLGMASRETTPGEQQQLQDNVDDVVVASDAVAVVVSKAVWASGIRQLTLAQIASIYRGKITNWHQLGGIDAKILVIDKEASRGTRHVFAKAVLGSAHARAVGASIISGSNNEEQAIVARSNSAIGMLSNAWLNDRVRGMAIVVEGQAITPDIAHVRDGSYPIARGLHILRPHQASAATRDFVEFLLSPAGQKVVATVGYLPVK